MIRSDTNGAEFLAECPTPLNDLQSGPTDMENVICQKIYNKVMLIIY